MSAAQRLWSYAKPDHFSVFLASTYSILNKLFDVAPEILIGLAVDVVVNQEHSWLATHGVGSAQNQLYFVAFCTFWIWFFESFFEYLHSIRWRRIAQNLQHRLRIDSYGHVQRLPISYFENQSLGSLTSILNDDINQLERFLDGGANSLIQVATSVVLVGGIFFYLSPLVATLSFLPMPIIIFGASYFQKRLGPLYADVREKAGVVSSRISNNLSGIANIKSYATEEFEAKRLEQASQDYRVANTNAIKISAAFVPIIRMAILSGFLSTLVVGGFLVFQKTLAVGSYSILVFLTQRLLWPLTGLASTVDQYQRAMASTNRVLDLLEQVPEVDQGQHSFSALKSDIQFRDLDFSYPGRDPLFQEFNLNIPAGQTVGLVGMTGSGKSTLVKLLLRFYEPQGGSIQFDGVDIREIKLAELRRGIGYVSQETFLTDDSIASNISYGGADIADVSQAARLAEAHDFVEGLPEKYASMVGERGQRLSGGQRQRLSIARVIQKDPPVLIFDEATSAVDNETEASLSRSLKILCEGRTTILIAHRLSTLQHADVIHVIAQGQVVESGHHQQLLDLDGAYAALWKIQTGSL